MIYTVSAAVFIIAVVVFIIIRVIKPSNFFKDIETYLARGEYAKVKSMCLRRVTRDPNNFVLKYYLGEAMEGMKDYPGAIAYYEKAAISAAGQENEFIKTRLYFKTANLYKKMKKSKEALGYYMMVLDRDPSNKSALFATGEIYFQLKNYPKATEILETLIKLNPDHPISHYMLGYMYFMARKYQESIPHLQYIVENNKYSDDVKKADVIFLLAGAHKELKNYRKAIDVLTYLIEDREYLEDAITRMVEIYFLWNDLNEASRIIGLYINKVSYAKKCELTYYMGNIYFKREKYNEAIRSWHSAYQMNKNFKDLREIEERYKEIILNPKTELLFYDNEDTIKTLFQSIEKGKKIDNLVKKSNYWLIQSGNNFHFFYRLPQKPSLIETAEMDQSLKSEFNANTVFYLYSLFGVQVDEKERPQGRFNLISHDNLIDFINKAF